MTAWLFAHAWWVIALLLVVCAVVWTPVVIRFRWPIALGAVALLAGVFWLQANDLRGDLRDRDIAVAQTRAARAVDAAVAQAGARDTERASAEAANAIDTAYQKGKADGEAEFDHLRAAVGSGALVLRDSLRCPRAAAGPVPGAAAGAGVDHGAAPAGFTEQDALAALAVAAAGDDAIRQLTACQALVRSDREVAP